MVILNRVSGEGKGWQTWLFISGTRAAREGKFFRFGGYLLNGILGALRKKN